MPKFLANGAALVPALFVLVSMCGSPVPAPPGSISGLVFYDTNHNAIHDVCDSTVGQVRVIATGADGKTAQAATNADGAFRIDDAPPGDDIVAVAAADGFVWPVTTTAEDATGTPVHVESSRETTGVEIGSATRSAFASSRVAIIGVIFNDMNENGVIDRNECGYGDTNFMGNYVSVDGQPFGAVGSDGTYELRDVGSVGDVVLETRPLVTYVVGSYPDPGIPADHPCLLHAKPQRRYSANLFEANIAFTGGAKSGAVSGHIFDDVNGNGVRDADEPGVPQQALYLSAQGPTCGTDPAVHYDNATTGMTDADGFFTLQYVPMGVYTIQLAGPKNAEFPDAATIAIPKWPQDLTVTIRNNQQATLNLPLNVEQSSTINVYAFDDANGNAVWDTGEDPIAGQNVCTKRSTDEPGDNNFYVQYDQSCGMTDRDGLARLTPLISGLYDIPPAAGSFPIDSMSSVLLRAPPPARQVTLSEGEQLAVYLPLDVISVAEQVIAAGAGTPVVFETCYSDPAWVQRPFEEGFASSAWQLLEEETAREIYNQGIYTANSSDIGIWASIAGQSDWLALIPGCSAGPRDFGPQARLLVFVNYEPTAIVWSGNVVQGTPAAPALPGFAVSSSDVLQFTLRRNNGLYAVLVHSSEQERYNGPWYLFVDEDFKPIERRSAYGDSYGYPAGR